MFENSFIICIYLLYVVWSVVCSSHSDISWTHPLIDCMLFPPLAHANLISTTYYLFIICLIYSFLYCIIIDSSLMLFTFTFVSLFSSDVFTPFSAVSSCSIRCCLQSHVVMLQHFGSRGGFRIFFTGAKFHIKKRASQITRGVRALAMLGGTCNASFVSFLRIQMMKRKE